MDMCECGHDRELHLHFRRGDDCGTCGKDKCPMFRFEHTQAEKPKLRWRDRLRRAV